jgi:hypothetical protein
MSPVRAALALLPILPTLAACGEPQPRLSGPHGDASPEVADSPQPDASPEADAPAEAAPVSMLPSMFCLQERGQEAAWRARCLGGTAADWLAILQNDTPCAVLDQLVARGTARFHADLADACLAAAHADRDCSIAEPACVQQVVEGTLATDAPCRSDSECPADAACWAGAQFAYNACQASTCVHVPGAGEPCTQDPISYCRTGHTCVNFVCTPHGTEGAPCGGVNPSCAAGLVCSGAPGTCQRRRTDGQTCDKQADCLPDLYCEGGACRPRVHAGAPCVFGRDVPPDCDALSICDGTSRTCVPAGHLGQPCSNHPDARSFCVEGICHGGVCSERLPNGSDCVRGTECASGGCATGRCATCGG